MPFLMTNDILKMWYLFIGDLVAVYTPETNITSYDITSNGDFVVLATEGVKNLITLQLCGPTIIEKKSSEIYGNPENTGKTLQLQECWPE